MEDIQIKELNLTQGLPKILYWVSFWKYFWIVIFIIDAYLVLFHTDDGATLGLAIAGFIFLYITLAFFLGVVPFIFYLQVDDNKLTSCENSLNILTIVQKCIIGNRYRGSLELIDEENQVNNYLTSSVASSKEEYASRIDTNFMSLYTNGLKDYASYFWEITNREEHDPFAVTDGQRIIYELLWPLEIKQLEEELRTYSLNKTKILNFKKGADDFFQRHLNNKERALESARREAERTGRDLWSIIRDKSGAFQEKEYARQDKEIAKAREKDRAAEMTKLIAFTGRCPFCNEKISVSAIRCPHCTSHLR
ncbi:hypothetical protein [Spirosoma sp.]|uniref:hypothetical protein n=1 Tax=Spirosoma sp. TaxID=1899569 RepID=UPI003B3B871A